MIRIRTKYTLRELLLILTFYLLVLQSVLETPYPVFSYVDECLALIGLGIVLRKTAEKRRIVLLKEYRGVILSITVFVAAGLLGNILYRYQPLWPVLKDLIACLKFFLFLVAGSGLLRSNELENGECVLLGNARFVSSILFALLLLDLIFQVFPSPEIRYGLRVVQLGYGHSTYLAAIAVFLLGVLTLFYKKENNVYICFALALLFFTLRSKAIAGAAVYLALFFFVLQKKKRIRMIHIAVLAILAVIVGWEQFSFYYIELSEGSARAVLTRTSISILKEYFPIGTGFGTFASNVAAEYYSPLYYEYGIHLVHGLTPDGMAFGSDTFWPIVLGQTGFVGTIAYVVAVVSLFIRVLKVRVQSNTAYVTGIFVFAYLLISSTSESAFFNAVSAPLGMLIGGILNVEPKKISKE